MYTAQPHSSAFQPILLKSTFLSELEAFTSQLLNEGRKVPLEESPPQPRIWHPLTQLLLDMVTSLNVALENPHSAPTMANFSAISYGLLKNLGAMVQKDLFVIQSMFYRQLCKTILLEKHFNEVLKRFLSPSGSNSQELNLLEFDTIISSICKPDFKQQHEGHLYSMLGGSFMALDRKIFEQSLYYIVWNLGKLFTSKNNFITRNINHMKRSKTVHDILSCSVKFICNYQNKQYIQAEIRKISDAIFDSTVILKQEFLDKLRTLEKNDPISHLLWVFVDMLKAESMILLDKRVREQIDSHTEVDSSNFYEQEMQKLFKKCPYNGDECCTCKKCQCVRRNRESAKLSQEKKRNAVEQLNPLKKRIEELEKRNKDLEEENAILKGIFNEMKNSPALKEALSTTLDPISKVLND